MGKIIIILIIQILKKLLNRKVNILVKSCGAMLLGNQKY